MKNKVFALFLPLLAYCMGPIWAQGTFTPVENSLLWQISGNGLKDTSYLFGTIHIIPEDRFVLTEATKRSFDRCSRVTFEIDTEQMTNPMAMLGLLGQMYMANDTTLSDLLTVEDYQMVEAHFDKIGLPMFMMKRIKPMFLSILASEDMADIKSNKEGVGMMGDGMKSYELELTSLAQKQEKPIAGLETAAFQMSLFDSIPYRIQAKMLVDAIAQSNEAANTGEEDTLEKMIQLYLDEDLAGMEAMMKTDEGGLAGFEELLLLKRNRNWIPVMADMMTKERVFFAVGAGHLGGEEGVVNLLRKAGYQVTPIH
ncbi:MAG: TraB/GumN family protein [Saprospiraceae bacterium]